MRYTINFDKVINQLVPYYIGGRKLILYLQALVKPLQIINDLFVEWAKETRIETSMTSQIFKFEWFLNHKFNVYFQNSSEKISIRNTHSNGVPIYYSNENMGSANMTLHSSSENVDDEPLYYTYEDTANTAYSFVVYVPAPNTSLISLQVYENKLKFWIDKYKIVNKTYTIKYI